MANESAGWMWLVTWQRRVRRMQYLLAGVVLFAVKFALDWSVAWSWHQNWKIWNYVLPWLASPNGAQAGLMYTTLWFVSVPFFWAGIVLTVRRLRDAGKGPGWALLFFLPFVNLTMFLLLSLMPSETKDGAVNTNGESPGDRKEFHNHSAERAYGPMLGVVLAMALGMLMISFGAHVLMQYAWGLFLGVPFFTGFVASFFQNRGGIRSLNDTIWVSLLTQLLTGMALLGMRYEGAICLLMALPLALPFSIGGALLAREVLRRRPETPARPTFAAFAGLIPLVMLAEFAATPEPPMLPVTTSMTINAPVDVVWKNVVAFPELAQPKELIFHTGIAYPTGATIVGAVRYCHFTTGDFVEPITTWDENRLLAFDVAAEPQALRELSFGTVTPPHLERNYFRSRHGQFRLTAIDSNHTLLEGTTWYQNYFWPQMYWREVSDAVVHRIHMRVLRHVKQQAERGRSDAD